jgi:porphobilinogen deaminase
MTNESGDLKLLGNFRKLIDLVSADTAYKPTNATLKPSALDGQHTAALASAQDVPAKLTLNMAAISDRENTFAGVNPLVTRVHGVAKASGAPKHVIDDMNTFRRKLTAKRKAKPKVTGGGDTPTAAAEKAHSSAQLSYDNVVGHVDGYVGVLSNISAYQPNEEIAEAKVSFMGLGERV